ncbi:hypothetical protein HGRIS_007121 [Hohenbuehelia grisea]|uniref:Uncharacterized protein n=1 Tax=Hohenbuehelia grisea TaxID=104357 RepID=A0ABR3JB78_9AGAR
MSTENSRKAASLRKRLHTLQRAAQSVTSSASSPSSSQASSYAMIERPLNGDGLENGNLDFPTEKVDHGAVGVDLPAEYTSASHDDQSSDDSSSTQSSPISPAGRPNKSDRHQPESPRRQGNGNAKVERPLLDTSFRRSSYASPGPISPTSRAWYEFDLAVVVALVSPVGNWLTGGDHIKNLVVIVFLIFYLHQIIEVPWSLYNSCRARHPSRTAKLSPTSTEALDSLESLELAFLSLTVVSPFLGALVLRVVSSTIAGPEALSWFSITLFVLATGLRPWRHLVARANATAEELQSIICQGSCQEPAVASKEEERQKEREHQEKQHVQLLERMEKMEKALGKMKARMRTRQDEVYDYVDEAVEEVEQRVTDMHGLWEQTVRIVSVLNRQHRAPGSVLGYVGSTLDLLPGWLARSLPSLLQPSRYIEAEPASPRELQRHLAESSATARQNGTYSHDPSRSASHKGSIRNPPSKLFSAPSSMYTSPAGSSTLGSPPRIRLETIPEDGPLLSPVLDGGSPIESPGWVSFGSSGHCQSHAHSSRPRTSRTPSQRRQEKSGTGSLITLPLRVAGGALSWALGYFNP